ASRAQDVEFIIYTAPAPIRPRIIQCPVAMDKTVRQLARLLVPRQQAMPCQDLLVGQQLFAQGHGGVGVVVELHLHFAEAATAQLPESQPQRSAGQGDENRQWNHRTTSASGRRAVRFQAACWLPDSQRQKPIRSATFMPVNMVVSRNGFKTFTLAGTNAASTEKR